MKLNKQFFSRKLMHFSAIIVVCGLLGITYYSRAKYWYSNVASGPVHKKNAHIDAYDSGGMTGLMRAADSVDFDKVRWYLQQGANPNLQSRDVHPDSVYKVPRKYSPLHYVILRGSFNHAPEVMKLLLENGADTHLRDFNGNTPVQLIFFAVDGLYQEQYLTTLVQYGANPNAQNNKGNAFTHEAVENSNVGWIEWVRKDFNSLVNLNLKNKQGFTPMTYAQYLGQLDSANRGSDEFTTNLFKNPGVIIGADGNVNARDFMGNTALMCAIIRGDEARVKILLAKGASLEAVIDPVDKPALRGNTALFVAIVQQRPAMVNLLLEKSTALDVMKKNNQGNTPLHVAMRIAHSSMRREIVDALLKKGDELVIMNQLNVQNNNGETPFHAAIATGDVNLVRHLLQEHRKNIDLTIRNKDYKNAEEIAYVLRYNHIARLIQQYKIGYPF